MISVAERIKTLRESKKMTQKQLADLVGVAQVMISRYEKGLKKPGFETTQRLAKAFDVSSDYIMGLTDSPNIAPSAFASILGEWINEPDSGGIDKLVVESGLAAEYITRYLDGEEPTGSHYHRLMQAMGYEGKDGQPPIRHLHMSDNTDTNVRTIYNGNNYVNIPVVTSFKPCAGGGNAYAEIEWKYAEEPYPIPKDDIIGHAWQGSHMLMAEIEGHSMEPKYHDGDLVLFAVGEDFSNGDIVVAMWCGRLYIRGYFENADGVELRPRATGYETIHIQRGDERLHIVGKVIRRYPKSQKELGFYN